MRTRHVGATLGTTTAGDLTPAQFISAVGGSRYAVGHFFLQDSIPASLAAAPKGIPAYAGVYRATIDFEPTHYGTSGVYGAGGTPAAGAVTDAAAIGTFIQSCQAGGLDLKLTLWHEPFNKFNGLATNADNVLDYTNSMGYYGAVLRQYNVPVVFDVGNFAAQNHNTPTDNPIYIGNAANPGLGWAACNLGYIDETSSDFYVNQQGTSSQGNLNNISALAAEFGLPFGLIEFGFGPANATATYSEADVAAFVSYLSGFITSWVAGGNQLSDMMVWATNDNDTGTPGIYLPAAWSSNSMAFYQSLFDTYDGGLYAQYNVDNAAGLAVAPGIAGYMPAGGGLTMTGGVLKTTGKPFSTFTAATSNMVRKMGKTFSPPVVLAGLISTGGTLHFLALVAAAQIAGVVKKSTGHIVSASSAVAGVTGRAASRVISATAAIPPIISGAIPDGNAISFGGSLTKSPGKLLNSYASVSGNISRFLRKMITALTVLAAAVSTGGSQVIQLTLAGMAAAAATTRRGIGRGLSAVQAVTAAINVIRVRLMTLAANSALTGQVTRKASIAINGAVVPLTQMARRVTRSLQGIVTPPAGVTRAVTRSFQGNASTTGQVPRTINRVISANTAVVVALSRIVLYIITAGTAMPVAVSRRLAKPITGSIPVTVNAVRNARRALASRVAVLPVFVSGRVKLVVLAASIGTRASVAAQVVQRAVVALRVKLGTPFVHWATRTIKSFWQS